MPPKAKPTKASTPARPRRGSGTKPAGHQPLPVAQRAGALPDARIPVILEVAPTPDYALIDSGQGQKLERYGDLTLVRPEAQALWPRRLPKARWDAADAIFTGKEEEEAVGRWSLADAERGETWPMAMMGVRFLGRFTAFRHVGVFPEQLSHWHWMRDTIRGSGRPVTVLNLFGYTGLASLIAATAGASVTHVDASKKAIGWAKENQALAGLQDAPIRWICEDARKFVAREGRRGKAYDIILADPPKFGRGTGGEVWDLFADLPGFLSACRDILAPRALGLVLTAYSIRASFFATHELLRETLRGAGGVVESGELVILEEGDQARRLSTSLFSRWIPE